MTKEIWTFENVVEFGMEHGFVYPEYIRSIDFNVETEVFDYYQAIDELEEKGILIKYQ